MNNMESIMQRNWIKFLATVMKENGCKVEIRTAEDVLENLFYLSKEDGKGSRFISLQYKRIIEKLVCGLFNSALEYEDGKDVYFEEVTINGKTTITCNANVFWVQYGEDGSRKILGHGYHCLTLDEVFGGEFMSAEQRISKWKATAIGAAKSRALHDGGIGLEFYGDIIPEESKAAEAPEETPEKTEKPEKDSEKEYSALGLPVPKPKRGRPPKSETKTEQEPEPKDEAKAEQDQEPKDEPKSEQEPEPKGIPEGYEETPEGFLMSLELANSQVSDIGNFKGMKLGEIYSTNPKHILFLVRNSAKEEVREGAISIMKRDPELVKIYNKQ